MNNSYFLSENNKKEIKHIFIQYYTTRIATSIKGKKAYKYIQTD